MKHNHRMTKIVFRALAALVLVYVISYSLLRLSHILVARDYVVYDINDNGVRVFVNHYDIGRGSAIHDGQLQSDTVLGIIYAPLAFVELWDDSQDSRV